jgi:uncharacterized protein DUF4424
MQRSVLAVVVAALTAGPALANDSSAELATGGLVFVHNDDVEMRAEDLSISAKEIRVRYRFFNNGAKDVTTLVAFPMPEIKVDGPDDNIVVPSDDPQNLLAFATTVNGRAVETGLEQKVFALGLDRTELLRALSVPLAPHLAATNEALDRLPADKQAELVRLGLAETDEYDIGQGMQKHLEARWALHTTYFWQQTFPAQAELIVEHRYKPSVGGSVQTSLGSPDQTKQDWFQQYKTKYCMDAGFLDAADKARKAAKSEFGAPYSEERIAYILKTGANWSGPIKDFRLVVDKGDAGSLVSFCGQDVKKIAPTQFEMRKADFSPDNDLNVLILNKLQSQ